jgi:hypothetical protein
MLFANGELQIMRAADTFFRVVMHLISFGVMMLAAFFAFALTKYNLDNGFFAKPTAAEELTALAPASTPSAAAPAPSPTASAASAAAADEMEAAASFLTPHSSLAQVLHPIIALLLFVASIWYCASLVWGATEETNSGVWLFTVLVLVVSVVVVGMSLQLLVRSKKLGKNWWLTFRSIVAVTLLIPLRFVGLWRWLGRWRWRWLCCGLLCVFICVKICEFVSDALYRWYARLLSGVWHAVSCVQVLIGIGYLSFWVILLLYILLRVDSSDPTIPPSERRGGFWETVARQTPKRSLLVYFHLAFFVAYCLNTGRFPLTPSLPFASPLLVTCSDSWLVGGWCSLRVCSGSHLLVQTAQSQPPAARVPSRPAQPAQKEEAGFG